MSEYNISSLDALRLASLRSKGYTAEQVALLAETLQEIINDINASLETCEAHVESAHAPYDAEPNAIVSIKKNGVAVAPVNKIVDISVPTKVSQLTNDSAFATEADVDEKVNGAGHLTLLVVESVPSAATAQKNTIYFVRKNDGESGNQYKEYMLINGALELVGSNDADLSAYVTQDYVAKADDTLITEIVNTLAASKEKYVGTANLAKFWELVKPLVTSDDASITDLTARVELLELCVMNGEIEGNPFYITFESLDGVAVSGVWNTENKRIDF